MAQIERTVNTIPSHDAVLRRVVDRLTHTRSPQSAEQLADLLRPLFPRVAVGHTTPLLMPNSDPSLIAALYTDLCSFALDYAATDACTGVAQQIARLDGSTVTDGQTIDVLLALQPGPHTFSLEAQDALGNPSTTAVQFDVVVTPESLIDAIERLAADGLVKDPGTSNALAQKAKAAGVAWNVGACDRASRLYEKLVEYAEKHTPKKIDPAAAAILATDAEWLVTHCD